MSYLPGNTTPPPLPVPSHVQAAQRTGLCGRHSAGLLGVLLPALVSLTPLSPDGPSADRAPVDSTLVLWLPFDGDMGDRTGNGQGVPFSDPRFVRDRTGTPRSALAFERLTDRLVVHAPWNLDFSESRAVSLGYWFCVPDLKVPPDITASFSGRSSPICRVFLLDVAVEGNAIRAAVHASECRLTVGYSPPGAFAGWHHVFCVVNDEFLTLYFDGVMVDRRAVYDMKWEPRPTQRFFVSPMNGTLPRRYVVIDDLRLYRRTLDADEVLRLSALERNR